MEFNPNNPIVKLCLQGMGMDEQGNPEEAVELFLQAWSEAQYDFEKFISAHYVARLQQNAIDKLHWLETALQYALEINDDSVKSAFPNLYLNIAKCYEELNSPDQAKANYDLSKSFTYKPSDKGPFYHGTKANLQIGDMLTAGRNSNYELDLTMNHIYFTAIVHGAGLAAELAQGEQPARVYIVEPMGQFENDPNVTDKKFPGNPTRSYRSAEPLKIVGETTDWPRLTPEELHKWRERLAANKGKIIN